MRAEEVGAYAPVGATCTQIVVQVAREGLDVRSALTVRVAETAPLSFVARDHLARSL